LRISPSFSVSLFFFSGGFMLSVRIEKRRRMLQPAWSHSVFLPFRLSLLQILSRLRRLSPGKFVRDFGHQRLSISSSPLMPTPFSRRKAASDDLVKFSNSPSRRSPVTPSWAQNLSRAS
jgi:hypothetical protein